MQPMGSVTSDTRMRWQRFAPALFVNMHAFAFIALKAQHGTSPSQHIFWEMPANIYGVLAKIINNTTVTFFLYPFVLF